MCGLKGTYQKWSGTEKSRPEMEENGSELIRSGGVANRTDMEAIERKWICCEPKIKDYSGNDLE